MSSAKNVPRRVGAQALSVERARIITDGISDLLAQFAPPDFEPDGSLNINTAARKLIRLRLIFPARPEPSRALSGALTREEILAALDQLECIVKKRNGGDPLKRLWRNLSDLVHGHRTDFQLTAPRHAHYQNVDLQFLKGSLVAIMQKKRQLGLSPAEAVSWLARRIPKEPKLKPLGIANVDANDILGWRRQCQTKKSAYRAAYREWLAVLDGVMLTHADCDVFVSAIAERMSGPDQPTT